MKLVKLFSASSAMLVLSAMSASAQQRGGWFSDWLDHIIGTIRPTPNTPHHNVPEIDASSGLLAMAAVLAALLLAWEIKRRRG